MSDPRASADVDDLISEFTAMKEIGMDVPEKAFEYARANPDEIEEYRISMKFCDIADLVISLVR